ncbi:MAG: metalloregulator ArsR/SmtB family transcription factor [Desulfurivibrionaceae bacterium]
MKEFIKVMKALSDPGRVKILKILQVRELCVCEIKALLGLAQPTVSKHLKLLEEAGLVTRRKEKLWVNYRLAVGGGNCAAAALEDLRDRLEDDPEIRQLRKMVPLVNREELCR